jgi:hypothetical protein
MSFGWLGFEDNRLKYWGLVGRMSKIIEFDGVYSMAAIWLFGLHRGFPLDLNHARGDALGV